MDLFSEACSLLDMEAAASSRLEAGGSWSLRFPAQPHIKFVAVLRGRCWIRLPGEPPHRLEAGDTYLLTNSPSYVLANDLEREADDAIDLYRRAASNIVRHGGDDTVLLGGGFVFQGGNAQLLIDGLPTFICIPANEPAAAVLRGTLQVLDSELGSGQMGASLMARRLADILLVQALRAYVAGDGSQNAGWLSALGDEKIAAVLRMMHRDVARNWTVGELAAVAGMSRSGFALRFRTLVGLPPCDYLTRWRMQLARHMLRRGEGSIATLSTHLGYASESAFSNAFKRAFGAAPRSYRAAWRANAIEGSQTPAKVLSVFALRASNDAEGSKLLERG